MWSKIWAETISNRKNWTKKNNVPTNPIREKVALIQVNWLKNLFKMWSKIWAETISNLKKLNQKNNVPTNPIREKIALMQVNWLKNHITFRVLIGPLVITGGLFLHQTTAFTKKIWWQIL